MPIFQDDLVSSAQNLHPQYHRSQNAPTTKTPLKPPPVQAHSPPQTWRRISEESIRTEFCDGPIPDSPRLSFDTAENDHTAEKAPGVDRRELIDRLKRTANPAWATPAAVSTSQWVQLQHSNTDVSLEDHSLALSSSGFHDGRPTGSPETSRPPSRSSSPRLLAPAEVTPEKKQRPLSPGEERVRDGLEIERPRSALHRGDFRSEEPAENRPLSSHDGSNPGSASASERGGTAEKRIAREMAWMATSPPRNFNPFRFERSSSEVLDTPGSREPNPSPVSSSFSTSFAYRPPTTPLVQSESNEDLEYHSVSRPATLRHSSTQGFDGFLFEPLESRRSMPPRAYSHRRSGSMPYQAHQPRRSFTSSPGFLHSVASSRSPSIHHSRRISIGSESSPIQHASMVGSYEESILRGRMSTTPSKPLDFLAQIGVLGKGKCKPSLKCPQHVTLPFHAVFYSYASASAGGARAEDGPSPYVGQIDLENGLPDQTSATKAQRRIRAQGRSSPTEDDTSMLGVGDHVKASHPGSQRKRHPQSQRAPPGGSYRIPEMGQIQIIIKNQDKTAVKLFLVPYDLTGMEPGTKTFIRQRCYSAGPIIDGIPPNPSSSHLDRPILRYLVHLHVCCPSRGRYYLYKNIRVVFANRVPDGKENLRNETTWPEPRFSPYKPIRMMRPPISSAPSASPGSAAPPSVDRNDRRRSLDLLRHDMARASAPSPLQFDGSDGACSPHSFAGGSIQHSLNPIPLRLPSKRPSDLSDIASASTTTTTTNATINNHLLSPTTSSSRPNSSSADGDELARWGRPERYEKLRKGDAGYGGGGSWGSVSGAEGLLSMQLQELDVKMRMDNDNRSDQERVDGW